MALLSNDPQRVALATGFDSWYHSLPARLALDGFRSELPLVRIGGNGRPTVMMKELDRTNVELDPGADVEVIFHNPYFTFDGLDSPSDACADVVAAAEKVVDDADSLDPAMSVALFSRLSEALGIGMDGGHHFVRPGYHYRIPRRLVASSFARSYRSAQDVARPYIERLGISGAVAPFMEGASDDGLAPLDRMMKEAGVDVLVASSPLNVQELTGFPMGLVQQNVWAVVQRDSSEIDVLSRRELPWLQPALNRVESDFVSRLSSGGTVGYEELDLSVLEMEGLGLDRAASKPMSGLFRRWRERRSWRDIPYYVLASNVTLRGVEAALDTFLTAIRSGDSVTELDGYRRYRETVEHIIQSDGFPIRVETYFTHTHAGNRSLLPARATPFRLPPLTSLKIDAGLLVYDEYGLYRAVSDITRSIVGGDSSRWFYDLLTRSLAEVISACRPGATGDQVFRRGMAVIDEHRRDVIESGLAPPNVASFVDGFRRDIGHLLGKEEPATVGLKVNDESTLESGMVGAAEFQWPFRDHCIGVEDLFLITEEGAVNLTRTEG